MKQWSQAVEWRCFRSGLARTLPASGDSLILPLFVLFDARVVIDTGVAKALADRVGLGVPFGLLIGTRVGITAASWILIRFGLAEMSSGANSGQIHGSAILAGVGFTMSLFVSDLAFGNEQLIGFSKVGILAG